MRNAVILAMAVGFALIGSFIIVSSRSEKSAEPVSSVEMVDEEPPSTINSKFMVVGDVFWGRHIELLSNQSPLGFGWPFSGVEKTFDKSDYQAWVANVECPVTNETYSYSFQIEKVVFNCRPEFLDEFAKLFDVVSLANNHTDNVNGEAGLLESRRHIESADLQHFGHYDPTVSEDICEIITIPILVDNEKGEAIPVAFCGVHGVYQKPTQSNVAIIEDYAKYFPTVVMPHMGAEYVPHSDAIREELYRHIIDLGADVVLGNQPHWVQNSEAYKGKLILYSMGNFIFDQAFDQDVVRGVGVDIALAATVDDNLRSYIEMAKSCQDFKDDCLQQAVDLQLEKPDITLSFDLQSFEATNYLTAKATAATHAALLQRTNWNQTLKQLAE